MIAVNWTWHIIVFLSYVLFFWAAYILWRARPDQKLRRAVAPYAPGEQPKKVFFFFSRQGIEGRLSAAGASDLTPEKYLGFKLLLPVLAAVALRGSALAYLAVPAFFFLPDIRLRLQRGRRRAELLKQLPGCLDIIGTLIAAGMDIGQAISSVPAVLQEPLKSEIKHAGAEYSLTRDLRRALGGVAKRTGMLEFEHLMYALLQAEVTGRVREVLAKQSDLLRKRQHFANARGTSNRSLVLTLSMAVLFFNAVLLLGGPIFFSVMEQLTRRFVF